MTKTKKYHLPGITLMELIIAAAIGLLLLEVLSIIFWQSYKTNQKNYIMNDMQMRAKRAVDQIKQDVTKTTVILTTYNGFTTDTDTLILKIPRLDANQAPIPGTYNFIIWERDPADLSRLHRIEYIDATTKTTHPAREVSNLNFIYKDKLGNLLNNNFPLVTQVNLTLTLATSEGGSYEISYSTTTTLRNR